MKSRLQGYPHSMMVWADFLMKFPSLKMSRDRLQVFLPVVARSSLFMRLPSPSKFHSPISSPSSLPILPYGPCLSIPTPSEWLSSWLTPTSPSFKWVTVWGCFVYRHKDLIKWTTYLTRDSLVYYYYFLSAEKHKTTCIASLLLEANGTRSIFLNKTSTIFNKKKLKRNWII